VNYWNKLTGDEVAYHPYRQVAVDYPGITQEIFRRSIQFISVDGKVYRGAQAV
jgi:hypothetical protein